MKARIIWVAFLWLAMSHAAWGTTPDQSDQYFPIHKTYAASHILISYFGADKRPEHVHRNKAEAKARAEELLAKVLADPSSFERIAAAESDGPSAANDGYLGGFNRGSMAPAFEKAVRKLEDGAIFHKPVKTGFGYHIVRRNSVTPKHFCARIILFTHKDIAVHLKSVAATGAHLRRSPEEAKALAEALAPKVTADNFETLVTEHSDFRAVNGRFGIFHRGKNALANTMAQAVDALPYDGVSGVVETQAGYAIIKRLKVYKRATSDILISHISAQGAPTQVTRSRAEAEALAREINQKVLADPASFEALAREHSDGIFAFRGGSQLPWFRDTKFSAYERVVETLQVGALTTEPVETPGGFFIVRRESLD
ncbi:Peptidylprolyl isomerase [Sulfidibacter corallicola]|uniref:peptidylprolyl isomerase n=1 Tax=Sulfidibacter corallicola TaxID=2818388 RepID=A0A8A4TGR4_SULCO|nr:peptidylprolyl isomerase [Sulfidibacter corallicola]QTD47981.1 peptidylprolyl isomerase [Sulfidibacter corallicola]